MMCRISGMAQFMVDGMDGLSFWSATDQSIYLSTRSERAEI